MYMGPNLIVSMGNKSVQPRCQVKLRNKSNMSTLLAPTIQFTGFMGNHKNEDMGASEQGLYTSHLWQIDRETDAEERI